MMNILENKKKHIIYEDNDRVAKKLERYLNSTILKMYKDEVCKVEVYQGSTIMPFDVIVYFLLGSGNSRRDDIINKAWDFVYNATGKSSGVYSEIVDDCQEPMKLQESIRRILKEERNISDIIKIAAKEYNCSTWEINNGYCEDFALNVLEKLGGYEDNLFELSGDMFFNQRDPEFAKENWGDVIETNYGVWSKNLLDYWGYPPNVNLNLVDDEINHVWLFYNGKHYDAEVPEGVDNWFEIPLIKRLFNRYKKNMVQESIRRILKEETSLQNRVKEMIESRGVVVASKVVGGINNLVKILGLDMDDINTQEMLVKNFIYYAKLEGIDILYLEINRNRPDKIRIKIHFDTNINDSNSMDSWVTRTMTNEINDFFPFKSSPYWQPAFAGRGVTVILDSEQIVNTDDEDEMNLQETELTERCWKGYTQKGMKTMFGKRYPNCVKKTK